MNTSSTFDPTKPSYIIDPNLEAVVELALDLEMPLLVTGEPGTGKTKLASYIAAKLDVPLLEFITKTTAKAKDLLYKYNALLQFRDAQTDKKGEKEINAMDYVSFEALGKAILESHQQRYVVLIDEIDKAPRDFPNDVLFEFEQRAFKVEEASVEEVKRWCQQQDPQPIIDAQGTFRIGLDRPKPVLILTSNSEKNLPDAFLRRCAYYHIPFPDEERLIQIVHANVPLSSSFSERMLEAAIAHFMDLREENLRKAPATAELLAWVHVLQKHQIDVTKAMAGDDEQMKRTLIHTYALLFKNKEDQETILARINYS